MRTNHNYGTDNRSTFTIELQELINIAESVPRFSAKDRIHRDASELLLAYIAKHYKGDADEFYVGARHRSAIQALEMLDALRYVGNYASSLEHTEIDEELDTFATHDTIAVGRLKHDIKFENNDAYQTAGGYIHGVALKDTLVRVCISYNYTGFKLVIYGEVNVTLDHYNNNFFGNSTGNGTKRYEIGERIDEFEIMSFKSLLTSVNDANDDTVARTVVDFEKIAPATLESFIRAQERDYYDNALKAIEETQSEAV